MKGCLSMVVGGAMFWVVVLMPNSVAKMAVCFVLLLLLIILFSTPND